MLYFNNKEIYIYYNLIINLIKSNSILNNNYINEIIELIKSIYKSIYSIDLLLLNDLKEYNIIVFY